MTVQAIVIPSPSESSTASDLSDAAHDWRQSLSWFYHSIVGRTLQVILVIAAAILMAITYNVPAVSNAVPATTEWHNTAQK